MKTNTKLVILIAFLSFFSKSYSQFSHELGVTVGPVVFQGDYGERNHLPSSTTTSFGVAVVHHLSFFSSNYNWRNGASFFSDHFKLRTELSYYFANDLKHKGRYVESNSPEAIKLEAMTGSTKMYSIGTQLEFYFKNLEDYGLLFNTGDKFAPYVGLGLGYSFYSPEIKSSLGDYRADRTVLPSPWQPEDATYPDADSAFSFTMNAGTRFNIMENLDLIFDVKWQYFFSDKIEGLDAPRDVSGSRFNDTLLFFNIGATYDLSAR